MIAAVAALVNVLFILQGPGLVNARLKARLAGDDGHMSVSSGLLQLTDTNTSSSSTPDMRVWHTPFFPSVFSWHSLPRVLHVVCHELGFPDGAVFGAIDEGRTYRGWSSLHPRRLEDILCGGEEMGIDECLLRKWSPAEVGVDGYHPLWINCDDGLNSVGVNCYNWNCEDYLDGYHKNIRYLCQCDPYCELFGDCCFDHNDSNMIARRRAVFGNSSTSVMPDLAFWTCVDLPFRARVEEGFWLVTKCPQSYQDQTVRQLCEASSNGHDDRPVYDPEGIHFRNVYCALCHGSENTTLWDVCYSKSAQEDYCLASEVNENVINKNETFFYVRPGYSNSGYQLPKEYLPPRPCFSNIIRECRPDLKGSYRNIDIACRTLIGDIAQDKGKVFANSNCAICNGALDVGKTCSFNFGFHDTFRNVPWYEEWVLFCDDPRLKLINGQCVPPERAYWPECKSVSSRLTIEDHQQDKAWDCSGEDANVFRYLEESTKSIGLFTVLHEDHFILEVNLMSIQNMSHGIDSYIAANPRDTMLLCAPARIKLSRGCQVNVEHSRESFVQDGEWVHGDLSDFEPVFIGGENLLLYQRRLFLSSTIYQNSTIYALKEDRAGYTKTYSVSVFGVKRDISNCVMAILTPPQFEILTVEANFLIVSRGIFFHPSEYFIFDNDSVLVCLRTPEDVKLFMDRSGFLKTTLGRVGFSISSVSLALTLVTYSLFQELRNLHGLVIINMVLALLLSHILLVFVTEFVTHLSVVCTAIAASAHYFWLATFFWKTVLAFDLCKTLSSDPATALLANSGKVRKFLVYSAVGWGIPFVILATSLGLHFHPWQEESLLRYGVMDNAAMCWIVQPMANVVAFAIPCAICLCVNGILFIYTMRNMLKVRRQPGNVNGTNKLLYKNGWRVDLLIHAKISVLLGFTWISGFVASFLQLEAMWYVFIVINSLQGVVIFVFFGLSKRARSLWRGVCCHCNK